MQKNNTYLYLLNAVCQLVLCHFILDTALAHDELFSSNNGKWPDHSFEDSSVVESLHAPPPSSKCWKSAVAFLQAEQTSSTIAESRQELCNKMTDVQQKILTLEIAYCHMDDLGKPLFEEDGNCFHHYNSRGNDEGHDEEALPHTNNPLQCLKELTDAGTVAYTHYVSHVQILCMRLTQDYWLEYQQATQKDLLETQLLLGYESTKQWQHLHDWAREHQAQLQLLTITMPNQIQNLSQQVHDATKAQFWEHVNDLQLELSGQLGQAMNAHINEHKEALNSILTEIGNRQEEMLELAQQREWQWYNGFSQMRTEMEDLIQQQEHSVHSVVEQLSELLSNANWMNPTLKILTATFSFLFRHISWVYFVIYVLLGNVLAWVLFTRPRVCRPARRYVIWLALVGAAIETYARISFSLHDKEHLTINFIWWQQDDRLGLSPLYISIFDIRYFTHTAQLTAYVLQLVCGMVLYSRKKFLEKPVNKEYRQMPFSEMSDSRDTRISLDNICNPTSGGAGNDKMKTSSTPAHKMEKSAPFISHQLSTSLVPNEVRNCLDIIYSPTSGGAGIDKKNSVIKPDHDIKMNAHFISEQLSTSLVPHVGHMPISNTPDDGLVTTTPVECVDNSTVPQSTIFQAVHLTRERMTEQSLSENVIPPDIASACRNRKRELSDEENYDEALLDKKRQCFAEFNEEMES